MRPNEPEIDCERHLSSDELVLKWESFVASEQSRDQGVVRAFCLRQEDGSRKLPDSIELDVEEGAVGDRWFLSKNRKRE